MTLHSVSQARCVALFLIQPAQKINLWSPNFSVLQQPKFGHPPGVGGLGSDSDHVIASDDLENEQDARYYKFFGRQMPSLYPTEETDKESVGHGEAEENYRDLMLKPSPNEKHGNRNIQSSYLRQN